MAGIRLRIPTSAAVAVAGVGGLVIGSLLLPLGHEGAAAASQPPGTIQVQATGDAQMVPDQLVVAIDVTEVRPTSQEAMQASTRVINRAFTSLRSNGVLRKDIQTTGVSVAPHYRYDVSGEHTDGYQSEQSATFVLHNLGRAGTVLGAMTTAAGSDLSLSSATPVVSDSNPGRARARANAIRAAEAKAADYAQLTGRRLGVVLRIEESVQPVTMPPVPLAGTAEGSAASAAPPVRIQPGQQSAEVVVSTTWQLR